MDVSSEPSCSSQSEKIVKCTRRHQDDTDEEEEEIKHRRHNVPSSKLSTSIYEYLVLISIILIIFAAFRNSVTWHLQVFWNRSADLWQHLWDQFLDYAGEDEFTLFVWWTTIYTFCIYWFFGAIYTILDITNKPKFIRKYKIQPNTNEPLDKKKLRRVILQVIFNQIFVGVPFAIFSYYALKFRGFPEIRELPTFHWVLFELGICILVEEFGFYYSHRFLHSKHIYKRIHKKHHEWQAPVAVTAIYAHPIEHIFSNILPPFLGVFICRSHLATSWLWFTMALLSTLNAHSGYHFPFFPSPEAHDFHHFKFNYNFGMLGLLDRVHGTDSLFRMSPQGQRHLMLLSFIPAHEQFPDKPKKSS
ncbi:hypothetical protein PVAND_012914 [Polypedilum vanderplanki]|uniref:Fatty acid hydroxylase domain-containing protein n=1 Tax=Polypedilum vanderplanki TaxID=319348 RepID=A0A9J6CPV2_POLVA|nr:hypothetical protein PVAND_012914 [Polypedilum vanderplanki]